MLDEPDASGLIVMRDCGGTALARRLADGVLAREPLVGLGLQLAAVLAEVHRRGVVHKDVNLENLVCGPDGGLFLVDFDLATTFAEERPDFGHRHRIAGSVAYLAPEQTGRTSWPVDTRADLYAVGATLYEMATGQPPFGRGDLAELVHAYLARVPASPDAVNPAVPVGLAQIIMRLLMKERVRHP